LYFNFVSASFCVTIIIIIIIIVIMHLFTLVYHYAHSWVPLAQTGAAGDGGSKAIYMADVIVSYTATHLITRADRFISLLQRDLTSKASGPSLKPTAGKTRDHARGKECSDHDIKKIVHVKQKLYCTVVETYVEIQRDISFVTSSFISIPFLDPFRTFISFLS
jgi:hypothetical protein